MKPREPEKSGQHDMFRSRLDQTLNMSHEKVILVDAGYKGHNAPGVYKMRVFTARQKRRLVGIFNDRLLHVKNVKKLLRHTVPHCSYLLLDLNVSEP